jgi:tRNA-guanine family transglycosylase
MNTGRSINTRKGPIRFPTYVPVTTFGKKYPLDDLVRPYLPRLASAVMVSYHYAKQQNSSIRLPMMIDSGGFASLFEKARVIEVSGLGIIEIDTDTGIEIIAPGEVLEFQEQNAEIAFTLDFPIPPSLDQAFARERQRLTIKNALWAIANRRRLDMPLYACVQGWDVDSFLECSRAYVDRGFDGIAIGGLVPRARDKELLKAIVSGVRKIVGDLPIHVFGLGKPELVDLVHAAGADSVDSSAYVKLAADGKLWGSKSSAIKNPTPTQRLHLALCNLANATKRSLPLSVSPHLSNAV